jgi:APA family basic amino acid/polyamine antiporter
MGNIVGGGIFLLPASVAQYGTVSLVAFGVLTIGAIALALVFGRLAERDPRTGGPYVYTREAFGDFAGFLAAWPTGSPPGCRTRRSPSPPSATSTC